jgi:hypothetical protein
MFWYGFALGQRSAISGDRSPKEFRRRGVSGQETRVAFRFRGKRVALVVVCVVGLYWIIRAGDAALKSFASAVSDTPLLCAVAPLPAQRDSRNAFEGYCGMWRR